MSNKSIQAGINYILPVFEGFKISNIKEKFKFLLKT